MPDEPQLVKGIDWKSAFPFTLIFRSFRVAIHPSKLVLALIALILIYMGGRVLDSIWPADYRAVPSEIDLYQDARAQVNPAAAFNAERQRRRTAIVEEHNRELQRAGKPDGGLSDIRNYILDQRKQEVDRARQQIDPGATTVPAEQKQFQAAQDAAVAAAYNRAVERWEAAKAYDGQGLFMALFGQQAAVVQRIISAAYDGQWAGRGGVFDQFINFLTIGPGWAMRHHPVYFTLFGAYFLFIWAIFGGAVARIAAVHVARDEKISFRQALAFSSAKFLSFISAPIIPVAIVFVIGLVVAIGALVINIPFFGPIVAGVFFFLALAAGFVMTLVLLGLLGGFNLMYPTIAVEGSDSFDAISRSFSYLFARPWRMGLYTLVASAYGTICYVFIRLFIKLILAVTHFFVGWGVFRDADSTEPLWPVIWPNPLAATRLSFSVDYLTLGPGQSMGAFLIACWIYLTIAMLGAFLISFYFSANTIIYVLMRHEVDATELDDVYLEQTDEEFAETPAPMPPAASGDSGETTPPPPAPVT